MKYHKKRMAPGKKWNGYGQMLNHVHSIKLCKDIFFCSRDCCLCTKHQSVKELRHAGSKEKTGTEKTTQKQKQHTNPKTTKTKQTATTRHPFAAGETGETGETGTMLIKKLVQLCYERQVFFTREDVFTLPCREIRG